MEWKWVHLFSGSSKTSYNLLFRVELAILAVAGVLFFTFWAGAETCKLSKRSIGEVATENFVVRSGDNEALVLSTYVSKPEQRQAVYKMMQDELGFPEMLIAFPKIFRKDKEALQNLPSTQMFVEEALGDTANKYVLVNQSESTFQELEALAHTFDLMFYDLARRPGSHEEKHNQQEPFKRYLAATIGVLAYTHYANPALFQGVDFARLDTGDPLLKASDAPSAADARLQEILATFKDRPARRNLKSIDALLKNGGYRKYSNDTIKKDILDRFARGARPKIEEWVDLALKERAVTTKLAGESRSLLVKTVLSKQGKGLVFVPADQFGKTLKAFREACAH